MSDLNKAKKILIIDRYKKKRDLAQMNIYSYLDDNFNCKFISKISLIPLINFKKFDIIYLGIFHLDIHARGKRNKFQKDLNSLLRSLNKDQILIVDQADNEIFLEKSTGKNQIKYNRLEGKKYLIDRYSTNVLKEFADENNFSLINMQWSIDPDKFQNTNYETKDIDVTFISTIAKNYEFHKNREKIYQHLTYLQNKYPNYKFHISAPPSYPENQTYGDEYREVLSRSKIFIADGSGRYCLTQK
ncbi:MAG: hypothetical protein GQ534_00775 [Candidatus Delongbacteria bacterium]|nr:hypothetical protein [Candidatus Delongbacteria bacterium]